MTDGRHFWESVKETFSGWKALAATAVVAFGVGSWFTGGLAELRDAPQKAEEAKRIAQETRAQVGQLTRSLERLDRTVRIYICTRPELDWSTRIRLKCSEFD